MGHDPRELNRARAHLTRVDPVMAEVVKAVGPCLMKVERGGTAFSSLAEAILYQQITGKAAATIHRRLKALCPRSHPRPEDILKASDEDLRAVGLSRQKVRYLKDLAEKAMDGLALGRMSRLGDEEAVKTLTTVKGIGRWTAEIFLMFRLGRLDILPADDYGIQKAIERAYRMPSLPKPDRVRRLGEAWRPYRSVASWYLWRSIDGAAAFE